MHFFGSCLLESVLEHLKYYSICVEYSFMPYYFVMRYAWGCCFAWCHLVISYLHPFFRRVFIILPFYLIPSFDISRLRKKQIASFFLTHFSYIMRLYISSLEFYIKNSVLSLVSASAFQTEDESEGSDTTSSQQSQGSFVNLLPPWFEVCEKQNKLRIIAAFPPWGYLSVNFWELLESACSTE